MQNSLEFRKISFNRFTIPGTLSLDYSRIFIKHKYFIPSKKKQ